MRRRFGFSDDMVRAAQYRGIVAQISEEVAKGTELVDTVEKRLLQLNRGSMAAIDDLKGVPRAVENDRQRVQAASSLRVSPTWSLPSRQI